MDKNIGFDSQRKGEEVVAVIRNHPFVLFEPGLKTIAFWFVAVVLVTVWTNEYSGLLAFVLAVAGIGIFSRSYYIVSQSNLIITNQRVISISQSGFWARRVTETELVNIQDISSSTSGVFRTIFKYGDLIIRTSGATAGGEIKVTNIPNPYEVQQVVVNISKG